MFFPLRPTLFYTARHSTVELRYSCLTSYPRASVVLFPRINRPFSSASKSIFTRDQKPSPLKTALIAAVPLVFFGLGTWQISRLRWKVNLISELESRIAQDAVLLPRRITEDSLDDFEYRRVIAKGKFRHDQEMLLGPRTRGDGVPGYFVVTPFERENGTKILVKRGWIAKEKRESNARLEDDEVIIEGLLRKSEKKNSFMPENHPEKDEWYYADLQAMAEKTGSQAVMLEQISEISPSLIPKLVEEGRPVGRPPTVELRNTHLQYAITWYSLCAATSTMLYFLLRKPTRSQIRKY
ncbi:uncharacterized protein VTP21DRAFT_2842 [Calcarisporiella thermophila]|uniref:uncharacterized protein n=1 Tax=Calcarisporiella thermophila TaxID=911321 RepID=UPI003742447E